MDISEGQASQPMQQQTEDGTGSDGGVVQQAPPSQVLLGGPKRNSLQRREDLIFIEKERRKGTSVRTICDMLNSMRTYKLSHVTIVNDCKKIHEEMAKHQRQSRSAWIAVQIERLEYQREQAMKAWEESRGTVVITKTKALVPLATSGKPTMSEVTTTEEVQCGDPRYLAEARACDAEIAKLKGLYAPTKIETESTEQREIIVTFGKTFQPPLQPWKTVDVNSAPVQSRPKQLGTHTVAEVMQATLQKEHQT